jgi:hypothetical protein
VFLLLLFAIGHLIGDQWVTKQVMISIDEVIPKRRSVYTAMLLVSLSPLT